MDNEFKLIGFISNIKINQNNKVQKLPFENLFISFDSNDTFNFLAKDLNLFQFGVGHNEFSLINSMPFLCGKHTLKKNENKVDRAIFVQELIAILQNFFNCMWFIKDNSITIHKINLLNIAEPKSILSRYSFNMYSFANGDMDNSVSFSDSELSQAHDIYIKLLSISKAKYHEIKMANNEGVSIQKDIMNFVDLSSINRIGRSFYFLALARTTSFLPQKISSYISVLECLFTTDNIEVSHKVAERGTFYIADEFTNRKIFFKLIKDAYSVRSNFVHGLNYQKKHNVDYFTELSQKLDNLLRLILTKVILEDSEIFLKEQNDLNLWFTDLLLKK